jgi:hypothetical protein
MLGKIKRHRIRKQIESLNNYQPKQTNHVYVVAKTINGTTFGYWRGVYRGSGFDFCKDPMKAESFRTKEQAQSAGDNSLLYKYATYTVQKVKL